MSHIRSTPLWKTSGLNVNTCKKDSCSYFIERILTVVTPCDPRRDKICKNITVEMNICKIVALLYAYRVLFHGVFLLWYELTQQVMMAQGTAQQMRAHISDGRKGKQSKLRSFRHGSVAVSIVSTAKKSGGLMFRFLFKLARSNHFLLKIS